MELKKANVFLTQRMEQTPIRTHHTNAIDVDPAKITAFPALAVLWGSVVYGWSKVAE